MLECVGTIHNVTNQRIYDRNIPSQVLQPYFTIRPASSKYAYFPIVEPHKETNVRLQKFAAYNPHKIFNPGNASAPWSGYNANVESELRNQIFALQKCSQSVYVPKSTSDLYQYQYIPSNATPMPHGKLFEQPRFNPFNPNHDSRSIGINIFMNPTRNQIKEKDI
jgi:hypothetical protein